MDVRTDEPERRFAAGSSVVCGPRTLKIAASRRHSGKWLISFEGFADRTAAESLHGLVLEVEIDPAELPGADDEFYDHQLVGLQARLGDANGAVVGTVTAVLHLPDQDTLALDVEGREVLVPFVTELVPVVDVRGGFVTVSDIPGLLDPTEAAVVEQS